MTTPMNKRKSAPSFASYHSGARLYRAVINRAVLDLAHNEYQDDAREWLLSSESDYAFATAGISPDSIRQQVL